MEVYNPSYYNYSFANISNRGWGAENIFNPYVTIHMKIHSYLSTYIFDGIYGLGFIANLLLVTYIIKYRRYRTPIFTVILSLGISDAVHCEAAILWLTFRSVYAMEPYWMCSVATFLEFLGCTSSNYTIAVIAAIRFYQLVFPLSSHVKLTSRLLAKICAIFWLNALTIAVPFGLFNGIRELKDSRGNFKVCMYIGDHLRLYNIVLITCVHAVPLVATIVLHFVKHIAVSKQATSAKLTTTGGSQSTHGNVRESTDTRAVLIVIIVYIVTTLPVIGECLVMAIAKLDHIDIPIVIEIINKIFFLNSAINPFIYAFAAKTVRRDILAMVGYK